MKLAEALIERAEIHKKNGQLLNRIKDNVKVQEGDAPAEKPEELIAEYERNMERFLWLVRRINETNAKTAFDGHGNLVEAIALRDCLTSKINAYRLMYEAATIKQDRYNRSEIKFMRSVDSAWVQRKINEYSKELRELDTKIQGFNWTIDLIE